MPAATFSHSVDIDHASERAWAALQDPQTWSNIGPISSVSNPTIEGGVLQSFDWVADLGGKAYKGIATTTAHREPEHFALTMDTSEIAGDIVTTITETPEGSNVTVEIAFRTKGMLSAMFFPAIKQALASGFPQQVEDLATSI